MTMVERLFSGARTFSDVECSLAQLKQSIVDVDWIKSPAGPVDAWPSAVHATVRTVIHAASPMAVLIGREGIVVCNEAAREMFGDRHSDAQGRPIFEVLPIAADFYRKIIDEAYAGRSARFRDHPIKLVRDGRQTVCWFNLGLSPIMDDDGRVYGTLMAGSETTEHVRTRRALKLARERMEAALDAGGIVGTWDFDAATRKVIIDGSLAQQYGITEAEARRGIVIEVLFDNLHPDDRDHVLKAVDEAVVSSSKFRQRFRTITQDGALHWYLASGRPSRDDRGNVVGFAGIVIDVTSHTEAAAALEESNLRFETLVEAIPQIVWSTDGGGNHDFFNSRWTEFTGIGHEDITPIIWAELVHPDDWQRVSETWRDCLATGKTYDIEYRFRHHSGAFRWLKVIAMPMRDPVGSIVRWYGSSTDIDDAKQLEAQKELVNRELDHRIKNLFALVNGLVGLSTREHPELAPFSRSLSERLNALQRAHDLIRRPNSQGGGSIRQLIEVLLAPYRPGDLVPVSGDGADAIIGPGAMTSVALIFHELVTNGAKYGALGRSDGRICVSINDVGDWTEVIWTESFESDDSSMPETSGFGSKLLVSIVERQFRGTITRQRTSEGFVVTLQLPASLFDEA